MPTAASENLHGVTASAPHRSGAQHGRGIVAALCLALLAACVVPVRAQAPESAYVEVRPLIADMQRIVTPHGVQSVERVTLGGMEQWISIRGNDRRQPLLIYVHGGPGASELGRSWPYQRGWEEFFTVVQWDQRGTGKTLRHNGEAATAPTLTRARMGQDLGELIALLRERFGQQRVVLLGHSWGNTIALDAAMAHPEWISAYIGVGPLLEMRKSEADLYARLLAIAAQRNDATALEELRSVAPYPGDGVLSTDKLALVRKWVGLYGGLAAYRDNANFYFRAARLSPDYAIEDREAIDAGGALSVGTLIETLSEADLSSIRATPFPVFMFVGRHDLTTPPQITADWLDALDAPTKKLVWFEHSAHLAPHEEPGRFLLALVQDVLPIAQRDKDRR
jgi:pimeloyl-ACP methyl ester carboxylesterase